MTKRAQPGFGQHHLVPLTIILLLPLALGVGEKEECSRQAVLKELVAISEACCVKCTTQPCSVGCAEKFLPFHENCRSEEAYASLMKLGGGEV
jgi:hypothetical protein